MRLIRYVDIQVRQPFMIVNRSEYRVPSAEILIKLFSPKQCNAAGEVMQ